MWTFTLTHQSTHQPSCSNPRWHLCPTKYIEFRSSTPDCHNHLRLYHLGRDPALNKGRYHANEEAFHSQRLQMELAFTLIYIYLSIYSSKNDKIWDNISSLQKWVCCGRYEPNCWIQYVGQWTILIVDEQEKL